MKALKKGNLLFSGKNLKTKQPEVMEMMGMPFIKEGMHSSPDVVRKGKYSGVGYDTLMSPISEAERGNMPFMDPEFEYDSPEF